MRNTGMERVVVMMGNVEVKGGVTSFTTLRLFAHFILSKVI